MQKLSFLDDRVTLCNNDVMCFLSELDQCSIDLSILDPPYWKVVNEKWDRQWKTECEYIKWVSGWSSVLYEKMRWGGSIYLFGYFRTLGKLIQPLEDIGFQIRQQIMIDKGLRAISGRATKDYKMYPNTTESCLFLTKDSYPYTKKILLEAKNKIKISSKEINEKIGVKSNGGGMWSIYTGENVCRQIPTKEIWEKFSTVLNINVDYTKISQTFNTIQGITDVWRDIDFYKEKRIHPTQKPLELIKRLMLASSNENDLVIDPFLGSGSSAIAAIETNRIIKGTEKEKEYFESLVKRVEAKLM